MGYAVYGTYRRTSSVNFWRIEELEIDKHPNFHLTEYDLTDLGSTIRLLEETKADEVYNLAAQSHVKISFLVPEYTAETDGIGTLRLLDAIKDLGISPRFYQASTSELYGKAQEGAN